MITSKYAITTQMFAAMFLLGAAAVIIGCASRNVGLLPEQIGLLIAAQSIGFMIAVTLGGLLADRIPNNFLLLAGCLLLGIVLPMVFLSEWFVLNFLLILMMGMGMGIYEAVADPALIRTHPHKQELFININHFCATFGSLLLTAFVLVKADDWRDPIIWIAAGAGLLGLAAVFTDCGSGSGNNPARNIQKLDFQHMFLRDGLWMLFLAILVGIGIEAVAFGYIPSIYTLIWGFSDFQGKLGLLLVISGVATGRFLTSFFFKRNMMDKAIVLLLIACGAMSWLICFLPCRLPVLHFLSFLFGAASAPIAPFAMTIAGMKYPHKAGLVLGILKISVPTGAILVPLGISSLSQLTTFNDALLLLPTVCVFSAIILLPLMRITVTTGNQTGTTEA